MVLIHYNRADRLDDLRALWPDGAYTPDVIREHEIGDSLNPDLAPTPA